MKNLKQKNNSNGITLIALVITIIVLLILAAVSIATLTGENGILTKAQESKIEQAHATVWEQMRLNYSEYWTGRFTNEGSNFIDYLKGKNIIDTEQSTGVYVINIEALVGEKLSLGNGTDGTNDVYKLEEISPSTGSITKVASTENNIKLATENSDKTYQVMYYGESGDRELGILKDKDADEVESDANLQLKTTIKSTPSNGEYYERGANVTLETTVTNMGNEILNDIHIGSLVSDNEQVFECTIELEENEKVKYRNENFIGNEFIIEQLNANETITFTYSISEIKSYDVQRSSYFL